MTPAALLPPLEEEEVADPVAADDDPDPALVELSACCKLFSPWLMLE